MSLYKRAKISSERQNISLKFYFIFYINLENKDKSKNAPFKDPHCRTSYFRY